MDDQEWFDRLETAADEPGELFEHFETRSARGLTFQVLSDARHGLDRGTVLVEETGEVVPGYPSIPRILVLDPGVRSFFPDAERIAVEEKLNGFNVRVARVDGEALAFTRGGYVCPYTTARARDLLSPAAFFDDNPDLILCAELIGPETPYTSHDYPDIESDAIRVFDVRERHSGDPLPVERRRELCREYGFEQPPFFGWHDPATAAAAVEDVLADLDADEREGIVMKAPSGARMVKYTTRAQHHNELAFAFSLPYEHGRDFLFSRLLREAFQAAELEDDPERLRQRARELGESILLPMVETIDAIADGETVGEDHTVRGDPERIDALLDHLREFSLTLETLEDRREDGERVLTFRKVSPSTVDRIDYYLDGGVVDE